MPITAKLSREFYEKFGDKIANEFVNWFNQVDATYRSEFKDLFDANFAQLRAELEQRLAAFEAHIEQRMTRIEARMDRLEARVEQRFAELRADIERRLAEQTRWLFAAWAVVLASVIGLYLRH